MSLSRRRSCPRGGPIALNELPDRLLNAAEAAAMLRLQTRTLYKMAYEGRLPVVKVGRATRFRLSTLQRLMAEWERPAARPLNQPQ